MRSLWINLVCATVLFCLPGLSRAQENESQESAYQDAGILRQTRIAIRDIQIKGNKKTKTYIVEREVLLKKGESYTISDILVHIRTSRQNLMNTRLFVDASVDFTRWENDSMDIVVDVKERWYFFPVPYFRPIDRNWNVWINQYKVSFERVNYGIKLQAGNVTGRNDKVNVWLGDGYAKQLAFSYYNPFIDKKAVHGVGIDFAYSKTREINYTTRQNQQVFYRNPDGFVREQFYAGLGYSYRKGSIARHYVKLGMYFDKVADTVVNLNPKFFNTQANKTMYPELRYRYQYLNVDYIPYPTRGYTVEFEFIKRGFGGTMNLWQFGARASKHFPLPWKMYYSLQGEAQLKLPFDQPFINQPLLGYGDTYLRGMEYYVVDGVAGGFIRNTLRKEVASVQLKTGLKSRTYGSIPFRFYVKTYADMGFAYNKNNVTGNVMTNKFLYTGGFGLDIVTIYDIVLRFEYSFNQFNERAFFFHKNDF
jgi:outer membrane protein assembly factor BamA